MIKNAEDYVRNFLKNKRFTVNEKKEDAKGIDIVAIKNGQVFLIEVKKVIKDNYNTWKIKSQHPQKIDFILAVFDNGYILPIGCNGFSKSSLSLTKIARFIELLLTEQK